MMALHQKRTLAFINHFVVKTVQFLNNFAYECETKLTAFEMKMQKIEASLKILESKLSSIPDIKGSSAEEVADLENTISKDSDVKDIGPDIADESPSLDDTVEKQPVRRDPQYDKFFKMVQVGVPIQAVKLKIIQEGLDPTVLD